MGRPIGVKKPRRFHYYDLLVHIFVVILLISNLVGQKITAIGPFRISGAQVFFPITYIFGDVFTEVYGYAGSRRAIWIGFMALGAAGGDGPVHGMAAAAPDGTTRMLSRWSSTSCRAWSQPA